ncbi:MAG: Nramp family divalent metal transporter [Candidatus Binatia bacterium]
MATDRDGFRDGDLPPLPARFWQLVGPGAVLVGLSIGAGELIVWPRVTAAYGASMTWAAVLGVFLQLWLNLEIGRYTLATGESVYSGYARLSAALPALFLGLNVAGWIVPGWARACGGALKVLLVGPEGWGGPTAWTAITFTMVALVLFGPRAIYRSVEHTVEALVVMIVVGLIGIAVSVTSAPVWIELGRGIINIGYKDPAMPAYELFAALVFAGAGGTANLFYCYYLRDKGWGMGALLPAVVNPLRGREERAGASGFRIRDTAENRQRWRAWMRHATLDQAAFFWLLNTFTILLFIVGALAVLRPLGIVPEQELLVWQEASILEASWGTTGKYVFLLVGVATLFSTQLTLLDGVARSCADLLHGNFAWARRTPMSVWYVRIALGWIAAGLVLTYAYEAIPPIVFLLSAGFFGGIAMAIYTPLTLIINLRYLPPACRPSRARRAVMVGLSLLYGVFAIVATVQLLARWLG